MHYTLVDKKTLTIRLRKFSEMLINYTFNNTERGNFNNFEKAVSDLEEITCIIIYSHTSHVYDRKVKIYKMKNHIPMSCTTENSLKIQNYMVYLVSQGGGGGLHFT